MINDERDVIQGFMLHALVGSSLRVLTSSEFIDAIKSYNGKVVSAEIEFNPDPRRYIVNYFFKTLPDMLDCMDELSPMGARLERDQDVSVVCKYALREIK